MIQAKQLKELFKYIEQNWDVCVSQVDKTDIKRIFGGVLCDDIMNDTLHEVKVEPEEQKGNCSTFDGSRLVDQVQPAINPIEQAYERGEKIRRKDWQTNCWIKKHSRVHSIDERDEVYKNYSIDFDFDDNPQKWEIYTEPAEKPAMTEKEKIDHILTNKLTWKTIGNKRFYANMFSAKTSDGSRKVYFVDYNNPFSGYFETRIFNIDLSEWQPVDTSIKQPEISFDKDRFERMFCAVVAREPHWTYKDCMIETEKLLTQLDAYYAEKKGGNNG